MVIMKKDEQNKIDIKETYDIPENIMRILLLDKTTNKNIIWATDNYENHNPKEEILYKDITGNNEGVIKPRRCKSKSEQQKRTKEKAEVFTPAWVCNKQINYIDNQSYGVYFNTETEKNWKDDRVDFSNANISWEDYIKENRMEITGGEFPYVVSRYDVVSGDIYNLNHRIGMLDRKLRIVSHFIDDEEEWLKWVKLSYKTTLGYEWSGDNLLLGRENIYYTFIDFYRDKFDEDPSEKDLLEIANIISWNFFQMDGLTGVIPMSCNEGCVACKNNLIIPESINLAKGLLKGKVPNRNTHNGISVKIMDWDANKEIQFIDLFN